LLPLTAGDREIEELSKELISPKIDEMKEAIKKVIANITVGKDMSPLLPQLVNCLRTGKLCRWMNLNKYGITRELARLDACRFLL